MAEEREGGGYAAAEGAIGEGEPEGTSYAVGGEDVSCSRVAGDEEEGRTAATGGGYAVAMGRAAVEGIRAAGARGEGLIVVENPGFWNWTFNLVDEDDKMLAQIDRNWRGLGFELEFFVQNFLDMPLPDYTVMVLFTDAGQYAIRFGDEGQSHKFAPAEDLAYVSIMLQVEELHVVRQLTLPERAVALALAISLDSDYFSRRGGWGLPFLIATE
ncbi:Altered inheritance rate of mitochondria protein 25 [Zea mays]|uniref:Phospholipid scramblase n=1 Tax=Zea mays TaxID=4577 RepID=A0A3L6GDU0_MAIZE|nr:Altered inheritance rate of mitochondria protein 25 [Zea mays]